MHSNHVASSAHSLLPCSPSTNELEMLLNQSVLAIASHSNNAKTPRHRVVFVGLHKLYQHWKCIKPATLFDAIVIEPNISAQCIMNPSKHKAQYPEFHDVFDDAVFVKTLQWKYQQNALICSQTKVSIDGYNHGHVAAVNKNSFWTYLSDQLIDLQLAPLILTDKYYQSRLYKSKYGVSSEDIVKALHAANDVQIPLSAVQEVLYQSNPSLNIIVSVGNVVEANLFEEVSVSLDNEESKQADSSDNEQAITPFSSIAYYRKDTNYSEALAQLIMKQTMSEKNVRKPAKADPFAAITQKHAAQSKHIEDSVLRNSNDWFLSDAYQQ